MRTELQTTCGPRSAAEETDRIVALAEDLLVLASAERELLTLSKTRLRAAELIEPIGERYAATLTGTGRTLLTHTDDRADLLGDPERLDQALSNLVENALRYGQGTIDIYTRVIDDQLEVHVSDQGDGFPPDFLPTAFDRFSRADRSRPRGGVGLGLAIVQAIAHAHSGDAHATNRPEGGADVWITMPVLDDQPRSAEAPASQNHLT